MLGEQRKRKNRTAGECRRNGRKLEDGEGVGVGRRVSQYSSSRYRSKMSILLEKGNKDMGGERWKRKGNLESPRM